MLPLLGHRNWIAVVDAAYPLQVGPGLKTVCVREGLCPVLRGVLEALRDAPHVRPAFSLDAELDRMGSVGVSPAERLREEVLGMIDGHPLKSVGHEENIDMLALAARKFQVLILKTGECIPYTSVFIELACGYWDEQSEHRLRLAMRDGE